MEIKTEITWPEFRDAILACNSSVNNICFNLIIKFDIPNGANTTNAAKVRKYFNETSMVNRWRMYNNLIKMNGN